MFGVDELTINEETQVIFVADYFVEDITGGAELTTEALIRKAPVEVQKIKTDQLSLKLLEEGQDCYWIFCNYAGMDPSLIPTIVTNLKYSVVEYDYKFCTFRSIERHKKEKVSVCHSQDTHNFFIVTKQDIAAMNVEVFYEFNYRGVEFVLVKYL